MIAVKKLLLLSFWFILISFARAQDSSSVIKAKESIENSSPLLSKNVVKINLSSLLVKTFNVQYERAVIKNVSLALQGGLIAPRALPGFIISRDPTGFTSTVRISGWQVTPECRIYPGTKKGAPRGFYIAPYARYLNYKMTGYYFLPYDDHAGKQQVVELNFKGSYSALGAGLMIGCQFLVGNHISIDWFIASGHYGIGKVSLEAQADLSQVADLEEVQTKIHDKMNSLNIPFLTKEVDKKIKENVDKQGVRISGNTQYIGTRMAGVNVGFAF